VRVYKHREPSLVFHVFIANVYNVGKIKEDVPSSAKLIAVVGSQALDGPSSTDIIRNGNDFVNNNSSNEPYSSDNLDTNYLKAERQGKVPCLL
jgi:hypothetical protein